MQTWSVVSVFGNGDSAAQAVEELTQLAKIEAMSLVMSDRTAERAFSVGERSRSDVAQPLGTAAATLAEGLHPLAPLGAPGTGIVGAGPLTTRLERGGLGTATGLEDTLERLGLEPASARKASAALLEGGVLVGVEIDSPAPRPELSKKLEKAGGAPRVLSGDAEPIGESGILRAPVAPSGDQNATFEPAIAPLGEDEVNKR